MNKVTRWTDLVSNVLQLMPEWIGRAFDGELLRLQIMARIKP
jgi:hypothetical protein